MTFYSLQIPLFQPGRKSHCVPEVFFMAAGPQLGEEEGNSRGAVGRLDPFQWLDA